MRKHLITLATIIFASNFATASFAAYTPPSYSGFINDQAGVLSPSVRQELEQNVQAYEQQTSNEIAVLTIPDLPDSTTLEEAANTIFRTWGIGKEGKNNGVLFLVVTNQRKMRIEVGYGLEGDLTDIETQHIQDEIARPAFRENNFDDGIKDTVQAMQKAIGEVTVYPDPPTPASAFTSLFGDTSVRLVLNAIAIIIYLIASFGVFLGILTYALHLRGQARATMNSKWLKYSLGWLVTGAIATFLLSEAFILLISAVYAYIIGRALRKNWKINAPPDSYLGGGSNWGSSDSSSDNSSSSSSSSSSDFGGGSSGGGGSSSSW